MKDEKRVFLELYKPEIRPVLMKQEKPGQRLIANTKKLQYLYLLSANVQILRMRELEFNLNFFDKKIEYAFFDIPIDKIRVLDTCTNQLQSIKEPSKKPVIQILQ